MYLQHSGVIVCCVFVSFLVLCPVSARYHYKHTRCPGGRRDGDKWFDGCKWCVCQGSSPQCSLAPCSRFTKQVPPCSKLNSRWRDGCYACTCHSHGIECRIDESCAILVKSPSYRQEFLAESGCLDIQDDRCVCGVDGVPSCTAEVIDREALPAITIAMDLSLPDSSQDLQQDEPEVRRHERKQAYRLPAVPYREHESVSRRHHSNQRIRSLPALRYRLRQLHARRALRRRRSADGQWDVVNRDQPKSLLVISNNYCRYGTRWYGGGLRCYCDKDKASVTCGDPSFVATRIDGFRSEEEQCEEGHLWLDECRECHCPMDGVVMCERSDTCPLNFLIRPVSKEDVETEVDKRQNGERDLDVNINLNTKSQREDSNPNPEKKVPRRRRPPHSTTVIVQECRPGRRWLEGCKRCTCTPAGKKFCDEQRCLRTRPRPQLQTDGVIIDGRPYQRPPPALDVVRYRPVPVRESIPRPCGRFRPGQVYWVKCNVCRCLPSGPKCTAKSCFKDEV